MGCEKIFEFQDNAETSIATRKFQAWFRKEEVYLDAQMGDTFITVSLMIFQNIVESILHKCGICNYAGNTRPATVKNASKPCQQPIIPKNTSNLALVSNKQKVNPCDISTPIHG